MTHKLIVKTTPGAEEGKGRRNSNTFFGGGEKKGPIYGEKTAGRASRAGLSGGERRIVSTLGGERKKKKKTVQGGFFAKNLRKQKRKTTRPLLKIQKKKGGVNTVGFNRRGGKANAFRELCDREGKVPDGHPNPLARKRKKKGLAD